MLQSLYFECDRQLVFCLHNNRVVSVIQKPLSTLFWRLSGFMRHINTLYWVRWNTGNEQTVMWHSPWVSCCVWCRTAGGWGCSPCCGRAAAGWSSGTSAWPGPWGRRWPGPPPEDPSPLWGVWETTRPRPRADAWCVWRPLPQPPPTWMISTIIVFNIIGSYVRFICSKHLKLLRSNSFPWESGCNIWQSTVGQGNLGIMEDFNFCHLI